MKQDLVKIGAEPDRLVTADELARLSDAGHRYELVKGRLVPMSPTGFKHDKFRMRMSFALHGFVEENELGVVVSGETGFTLSTPDEPDTVLASDVAFVSKERLPSDGGAEWVGFPRLAPDLAVEVVSPSQYRPEVTDKVKHWLAEGVRMVWVIWPATQKVEVWRPGSDTPIATLGVGDTLDGLDVVVGFTYPVAKLFE